MRFLPVFLDLSSGQIVLVGSGAPAKAKLHLLRSAGANVRWFSQSADVAEEVVAASQYSGQIALTVGLPDACDLAGVAAVVCAAGGDIDPAVAALARAQNIPVNVVDRPDLSTFIFPAIVDRGDVVVAIGTGGASPVLARRLRERIEAILPSRIGDFAALMQRYRDSLAAIRHRGFSLRLFWEGVIDGPIGAAFLSGRTSEAEMALQRAIDAGAIGKQGVVHLVGAGPGDPDLLTLRALQVLQSADIIFHDDLVGPDILERARRDAKKVFVGKRKGHPGIGQAEINRRLVEAARDGHCVVRLKGGDPFIFGRGGEELEQLRQASIPVFVVPGITAALGCAAEAGLPLTFRSEATRLCFVTANTADGPDTVDWSLLGDRQTSVVVYMGLSAATSVRDGLISAGRSADTPAAVLARGTRPDARSVVGLLRDLPELTAAVGEGPAILVIGEAAARSNHWISNSSPVGAAA
jgi:uroporphyrin-III C-methyltransferase/precorrin-2 dehydrogenase/sirohydrochlorin ferrochelatase